MFYFQDEETPFAVGGDVACIMQETLIWVTASS